MALQWVILAYVVAAEAAVAIILTLPSPKALKSRIVSLISLILQPSLFVIPFSGFQLLDIYWKNEHRLMCSGEICTAAERDRYEKSTKSLTNPSPRGTLEVVGYIWYDELPDLALDWVPFFGSWSKGGIDIVTHDPYGRPKSSMDQPLLGGPNPQHSSSPLFDPV
ncbi:UNVERIFIED_CONTAM: hypothetical protein Scaly_2532000 [Sesamum calycinum]|uniref:Endoplasmic reticulum transmembrane protein n=1 Tax=Sesamum calycinum TaxID=2727403 RepID=A0AAW2LVV5_9LAMI